MKLYLAPMEGITGYVYRNAYNKFFGHIDKYFTPFLAANQHVSLKTREIRDILPENNKGINVIPQILTNNSRDFIELSKLLRDDYGYTEVNLNLGCPSGTVVTKKKGAGFLQDPDRLEKFFEDVFNASVTKISIKTRIGMSNSDEFDELLEVFKKFSFSEIIIHPRVREEYYRNSPDLKSYEKAVVSGLTPLCYNGDIFCPDDYNRLMGIFPNTDRIMLGRGVLTNPFLPSQLINNSDFPEKLILDFNNYLIELYRKEMDSDNNVLFKMKELWLYMGKLYPEYGNYSKKIKKASTLNDLMNAINSLLSKETPDILSAYFTTL